MWGVNGPGARPRAGPGAGPGAAPIGVPNQSECSVGIRRLPVYLTERVQSVGISPMVLLRALTRPTHAAIAVVLVLLTCLQGDLSHAAFRSWVPLHRRFKRGGPDSDCAICVELQAALSVARLPRSSCAS